MTILAQRDNVRIIGIRKCGHTSIVNTFLTRRGDTGPEPGQSRPLVLNSGDKALALGALRGEIANGQDWPVPEVEIAFIRNPVRRALSAWHHFFIRKRKQFPDSFRATFQGAGFTPDMTFEQFVDHLAGTDLSFDPHIEPFSNVLIQAGVENVPYALAPLEMIDLCWPGFMEQFNIDCPRNVGHANAGNYKPEEFLTESVETKLRELYSEDYRLWEYIYHEARAAFSELSNTTH